MRPPSKHVSFRRFTPLIYLPWPTHFFGWAFALLFLGAVPGSGTEVRPEAGMIPTAGCVSEVQVVCKGLESSIETCLSERGAQLSSDCKDRVQAAMEFSQKSNGIGGCLKEVQRVCANSSSEALENCISQNKDRFTEACKESSEPSAAVP